MKKIAYVLIIMLAAAASVSALDVSGGVKAGGGMVINGGDKADNYDSTKLGYGFGGGAAFEMGFHPMAAVEVDVLYTFMNGYGQKLDGDIEFGSRVSTLEFPVLAKGRFEMGPGKLTVSAGPSMILLLGDMKTTTKLADDSENETDVEFDNSFLLGVTGGIGYAMPAGPGDVTLDLRYTRTLTSMFDSTKSYYNRVDLLVGYSYCFLKK